MITDSHIGRTYPATDPYVVSAAKVAEFADALGDAANPAYAGPDAVAPPTFAVVLSSAAWGAMFDDPELGLALQRTMHADQRFDFARPLQPGDQVVATLTISKVRNRGNVDMVTVEVDMSSVAGEQLCTATSQLLHTRPDPEGDQQ